MKKRMFLCILLLLAGCKQQDPVSDISEPVQATQSTPETPEQVPQTEQQPIPAMPETPPVPPDDPTEFVRVQDYIPDIVVNLRYATENNFTGSVIYNYTDAWLRYSTVCKLKQAQEILRPQGYGICIWDAFRSAQAQDTLWAAYPDGNYVANPANGYSGHTRGDTVDITLIALDGQPVEMPSGFDDFSAAADRDYRDVSELAANHAHLLEQAMETSGFKGYAKEWWHYSDTEKHPPETIFIPPS